ncbi:MAG TPA: DUF2680 domain-containing protein [Candidatus Limnocylindrales bacterium]|nr:DUF2680 domain-containing protein [Candidatus Limnocylindrales bacterium]
MSKKLIAILLVVSLALTLFVSFAVFAQENEPTTPASDSTLEALHEEMQQLRVMIVQRHVELGNLTAEEGERIIQRMEERFQRRLEEGFDRAGGMFGRFEEGGPEGGWGRGSHPCWRN